MNAPLAHPSCRLAICRELLSDGNEWSIYAVNDQADAVDVLVELAEWEWGDRGHSEEPGSRVTIPSLGVARILRVDGNDAELSMSLSLRLVAGDTEIRLSFELGKLYLYRDPRHLEVLDKVGWLRAADECRRV